MNTKIILDTKLVGNVQGVFYVPSYQRGYRWGKEEVTRLLEDIYTNGNKTYCLQPVVVRKDGDRYELIDGQQRLTTLFILLQYIKREYKPKISLKYELIYETRESSAKYLNDINETLANSNIDFLWLRVTIGKKRKMDGGISALQNLSSLHGTNCSTEVQTTVDLTIQRRSLSSYYKETQHLPMKYLMVLLMVL